MGRLHARVYSQTPRVKLAGVFDANAEKSAAVAEEFGCPTLPTLEAAMEVARAVTIAVPTRFHLVTAEPFLWRRIACLIEKPLAKDVAEAQRIVDLASQNDTVVQVGHIERFNPAVRAIERLNIHPRFMEVTRISPLTFRSIDVGVVLDMMIHDIDIVLKLVNAPADRMEAIGVSVIGDVEDICNARVTFANGCVANFTGSRLSLKTERRLRVFSEEAYVSIDYQKKAGIVVRRSGNLQTIRDAVQKIRDGEVPDLAALNFGSLVHVEDLKIQDIEPLRAEQEAFVEAVVNGTTPVVSGDDALAAVQLAERIVQAIASNTLG
jgi:predicted dehydrogenase